MRLLKFTATFLLILFTAHFTQAQNCDGTFGEAVVKETFDQPGALPTGQTVMNYDAGGCPNDNWYSIVKSLTDPGCHLGAWHRVPQDHTRNGGYMMLINASNERSQFFERAIDNLCPNTTYRFSVFVLDLMTAAADGPGVKHPKLRFIITDGADNILKTYISPNSVSTSSPQWVERYTEFQTTAATGKIKLKIYNDEDGGNGNDLFIDDITFSPCGPIATSNFDGFATGTNPPPVCEGESHDYVLSTTVASTGYEYQWQHFENGNWENIPNEVSTQLHINTAALPVGLNQYRMAIARVGNIGSQNCRTYTQISSIQVNALPVVTGTADQTVCQGDNLVINAGGGVTYTLTGPGGISESNVSSPITIPNVNTSNSGTYTIRTTSATGCTGPATTFNVTVKQDFVPLASASASTICSGNAVTLSASPDAAGYTYKWSPSTGLDHDDVANPQASPTETTTYTVVVDNGTCQQSAPPVTVTVVQSPQASILARRAMFEGQTIQLKPTVSGDVSGYSWYPETGLDDPHSLTPMASPTEDITYTLTVTSAQCGIATASIFVRVYKTLDIPNTFTPNADGVNDTWNMEALTTYPESEMHVYNRNGQEVFRSIGYSKAWNGTYNGQPLPVGTYYYIIDLKNNTPKRTGYVTILR